MNILKFAITWPPEACQHGIPIEHLRGTKHCARGWRVKAMRCVLCYRGVCNLVFALTKG